MIETESTFVPASVLADVLLDARNQMSSAPFRACIDELLTLTADRKLFTQAEAADIVMKIEAAEQAAIEPSPRRPSSGRRRR